MIGRAECKTQVEKTMCDGQPRAQHKSRYRCKAQGLNKIGKGTHGRRSDQYPIREEKDGPDEDDEERCVWVSGS